MAKDYIITKSQLVSGVVGMVAVIAIVIIYTTDIISELNPNKQYNLDTTLKAMYKLDKKYNTNWREENIPLNIIKKENIDRYITDINELGEKIKKNPTNEVFIPVPTSNYTVNFSERINKLVEARQKMIEAQKYYHQANDYGPRGILEFEYRNSEPFILEQINCNDVEYLANTSLLLNKTKNTAHMATFLLDYVMTSWNDGQQKIGVNEYKTKFYLSRLGRLVTQIELNEWAIFECVKRRYVR